MSKYNRFESTLRKELKLLIESVGEELDFKVPNNVRENIIDKTIDACAALTVAQYSQQIAKQVIIAKQNYKETENFVKDKTVVQKDIPEE